MPRRLLLLAGAPLTLAVHRAGLRVDHVDRLGKRLSQAEIEALVDLLAAEPEGAPAR